MSHDGNDLQRYPVPEGRRKIRWSGRDTFIDESGEEHKACSSTETAQVRYLLDLLCYCRHKYQYLTGYYHAGESTPTCWSHEDIKISLAWGWDPENVKWDTNNRRASRILAELRGGRHWRGIDVNAVDSQRTHMQSDRKMRLRFEDINDRGWSRKADCLIWALEQPGRRVRVIYTDADYVGDNPGWYMHNVETGEEEIVFED